MVAPDDASKLLFRAGNAFAFRHKGLVQNSVVPTHARYVAFRMAEVAISQRLFKTILRRISQLGPHIPLDREILSIMASKQR